MMRTPMAAPNKPADAAPTALRRPPIRQATTVRSDVEHTFTVFVREIGRWWPTQTFPAGRDQVRAVTVEPPLEGRVYETWHDGTTVDWGRLLTWDPPRRFAMSWTFTPAPTEVELTFTALWPSLTRDAVDEFMADDPFLKHGVVGHHRVREWDEVLQPE